MSTDDRALVTLTIRYGRYGEDVKSICVPIDADLSRELMGGVELSDEPLSLLLASPTLYGGKENAVTLRRKAFKMRREVARAIADSMVPALLEAFGVNDKLDGYDISKMSPQEIEFYRRKGRL